MHKKGEEKQLSHWEDVFMGFLPFQPPLTCNGMAMPPTLLLTFPSASARRDKTKLLNGTVLGCMRAFSPGE